MIAVKVNGVPILIPSGYHEMKTETFMNIVDKWDGKDILQLFCIITKLDYKAVAESQSKEIENAIYQVCHYIFTENIEAWPLPEHIKLNGTNISIPKAPLTATIGQNLLMRQKLAEEPNTKKHLITASAIYLMPSVIGTFNPQYLDNHEKQIAQLPASQIVPIGFFFLHSLQKNGTFTTHSSFQKIQKTIANALTTPNWRKKNASNALKLWA